MWKGKTRGGVSGYLFFILFRSLRKQQRVSGNMPVVF